MKKSLYFAATALLAASCASDEIVEETNNGYQADSKAPINFVTNQKNITRAQKNLQDTEHYNFGVFAYKNTETVNSIMSNYLVGYSDETNMKGYKFGDGQTTKGDEAGLVDGKSMWQYEKLGSADYTYAGEGFYRAEQTEYMSNVANQYLRYWDMASAKTNFYAYAPYINGANTVTYVDGTAQAATGTDTYTMTFPDGTITDGYDQADKYEFMYASTQVAKGDYGKDVRLNFNRLNAKVNIKFWEEIEGYTVRIIDLKSEGDGVQAAASIKDGTSGKYGYKGGKYYSANGAKIVFNAADASVSSVSQKTGTTATNARPLKFAAPTAAQIGQNRVDATESATTYYAIPKGTAGGTDDYSKTGFTFHVSYELTSDTGERIVVKNATVFVPETYCVWTPNTHYTYVFKITSNSNGSTDPTEDSNIDPTDPEVPTEAALYPIVFDNCTISDYDEVTTEHIITDAVNAAYYDVELSAYSVTNAGTITVTIKQTNDYNFATNAPNYDNVTVTKADGTADTNVTYDSSTKKITVASGAAGQYIVTYTCDAADIDATHPREWTETFWVGNAYTLALNLTEVGTNGLADAKLQITATEDGATVTPAAANLYIEYPENLTATEKGLVKVAGSQVVVSKNAKPGVYQLVYSIDEGNGVVGDKKTFTVVDYQFALNNEVVYLNGNQTITGNKVADADHVYAATGFTVTGNSIAVPATTAEGTYTVTYTLYGSDGNANAVSTVQYKKTFEVRNIHAVALNATAMDRSTGTSASGDYSTDVKVITTKQNGAATTTDLSAKLSIVKADGTATTAGDFKITYVSGNQYNLEVKNTVAAANYRVKFVSTVAGADKAEYFDFVVTE